MLHFCMSTVCGVGVAMLPRCHDELTVGLTDGDGGRVTGLYVENGVIIDNLQMVSSLESLGRSAHAQSSINKA